MNSAIDGKIDGSHLFAAAVDGAFAGYLFLHVTPTSVDKNTHDLTANIYDISIHPDFRGQKVGTALLAHGESEMSKLGATHLKASVWKGNQASTSLFTASNYKSEMTEFGKRLAPIKDCPKSNPYLSRATRVASMVNTLIPILVLAALGLADLRSLTK